MILNVGVLIKNGFYYRDKCFFKKTNNTLFRIEFMQYCSDVVTSPFTKNQGEIQIITVDQLKNVYLEKTGNKLRIK